MANRRRRKNNSGIRKFFLIVCCIVFAFAIVGVGFSAGYMIINKNKNTQIAKNPDNKIVEPDREAENEFLNKLIPKQKRINIAMFGVDGGGTRTDVMIVGSFDPNTKKIDLVSVPRDTRITVDNKTHQDLQNRNSFNVPSEMKLNELHAYAGEKNNEYSVAAIEKLLGIDIEHYVKVNYKGFRQLVDILDGIDMDVPYNMNYDDPTQNLHIHVRKGMQHLDGKTAEGVVRYRQDNGGRNSIGDLGRIKIQQEFMKAVLNKLLSMETFTNLFKLKDLIGTAMEYVETDMNIAQMVGYAKYLPDLKVENMNMHSVPGVPKYVNRRAYFVHDKEALAEMMDVIINGEKKEEVIEESSDSNSTSKSKDITVLNGGSKNGLAGDTSDKLTKAGYKVTKVGTYTGNKTEETRIYVKEKGEGLDLKKYFEDAKIIVNPDKVEDDTDILIIVGKNE